MLPKMVLFDYGQTLFDQKDFSALEGYEAVMQQMTENPQNISVEAVTAFTSKYLKQCGNIFGYKEKRYWHLEVLWR